MEILNYDPQNRLGKLGKSDIMDILSQIDPCNHPDKYPRDAIGDARLYAAVFKDWVRYCIETKSWSSFDGTKWSMANENCIVMANCMLWVKALWEYSLTIENYATREAYQKHIAKSLERSRRESLLKDVMSLLSINIEEFDTNTNLVNFLNGTLNLKTGEFREHDYKDFITKSMGTVYDPTAACARWDAFINQVTCGDKEKAVFLQKALGYALSGSKNRECFFILYGSTSRNGKGTLMETVTCTMGDYARATSPDTLTQKVQANGGAASEDIARLKGVRLVNVSEPDKGMVLNSGRVKTLTGGDTITARHLYSSSIEYKPQFVIFMNTNHLPKVLDASVFNSGRIYVITFDKHFTEEERDIHLKEELTRPENRAGIFNWLYDGYKMLEQEGLNPPESVKEATDEYRENNDKLGLFVKNNLIEDSEAEVLMSDVYSAYT